MKKIILSLVFIIITFISEGQTKTYYKISGQVRDFNTLQFLDGCNVKLVSTTGLFLEVKTNKKGLYSFDSLSLDNYKLNIEVVRKSYLNNDKSRISIHFEKTPFDTIINFKLIQIPISIMWFPEVYFKKNSSKPIGNFQDSLYDMEKVTQELYHQKLVIIGYKDSLETIDKRKERAELIYNYFIKKGVNKNKLTIEISNKPNFGKHIEPFYDLETGKANYYDITESYILNAPIEKQESLRQLNRCVSFSIISDE